MPAPQPGAAARHGATRQYVQQDSACWESRSRFCCVLYRFACSVPSRMLMSAPQLAWAAENGPLSGQTSWNLNRCCTSSTACAPHAIPSRQHCWSGCWPLRHIELQREGGTGRSRTLDTALQRDCRGGAAAAGSSHLQADKTRIGMPDRIDVTLGDRVQCCAKQQTPKNHSAHMPGQDLLLRAVRGRGTYLSSQCSSCSRCACSRATV